MNKCFECNEELTPLDLTTPGAFGLQHLQCPRNAERNTEEGFDGIDMSPTELKGVTEIIRNIIRKVDEDYYVEDGGFISEWLQDDLDDLVESVRRTDLKGEDNETAKS